MTEQDKVTVDDIIGIVKTEEQTNSVEEVRKLRGRGNETAKRFTINGQEIIQDKQVWCMANSEHCADVIATAMNELYEENEQLRKEKECDKQVFTKKQLHELLQQTQKENEQLKSSDTITDLETEIMNLKTTIQQLRTDNTKQKKKLNTTMKENEQLKSLIKALKKSNTDYVNQIKKAYVEKLSFGELANNCGVDLE